MILPFSFLLYKTDCIFPLCVFQCLSYFRRSCKHIKYTCILIWYNLKNYKFSLAAISLSSIGFLLSMDIGVSPLSLITAALVFVLLFRITPVIIAATSTATEITIPNVLFLFSSASTSLKLNFNPVTFLRVQVVNHLSLFGIIRH